MKKVCSSIGLFLCMLVLVSPLWAQKFSFLGLKWGTSIKQVQSFMDENGFIQTRDEFRVGTKAFWYVGKLFEERATVMTLHTKGGKLYSVVVSFGFESNCSFDNRQRVMGLVIRTIKSKYGRALSIGDIEAYWKSAQGEKLSICYPDNYSLFLIYVAPNAQGDLDKFLNAPRKETPGL